MLLSYSRTCMNMCVLQYMYKCCYNWQKCTSFWNDMVLILYLQEKNWPQEWYCFIAPSLFCSFMFIQEEIMVWYMYYTCVIHHITDLTIFTVYSLYIDRAIVLHCLCITSLSVWSTLGNVNLTKIHFYNADNMLYFNFQKREQKICYGTKLKLPIAA